MKNKILQIYFRGEVHNRTMCGLKKDMSALLILAHKNQQHIMLLTLEVVLEILTIFCTPSYM
jgi:hypothetical protein